MQRRGLLALLGAAVCAAMEAVVVRPAAADGFLALSTHALSGDAARLGWSSLRAGFRVHFPAAASGRVFLARRHEVVEAVERELERTRFDPGAGAAERLRLERVIADAVRRAAPPGTVSRVTDIRIEAR